MLYFAFPAGRFGNAVAAEERGMALLRGLWWVIGMKPQVFCCSSAFRAVVARWAVPAGTPTILP